MRHARRHQSSPRSGDGTGRAFLRMRTPVHRTTTRNLQALYPFVVDAGLGSRGVYVGRQAGSDASFVFDPWEQYADGVVTNPNMLLAGVIGRGKSALAKSMALRMSAFGVRIYVPGDPKGEWGPVARAVGVEPIALGRGLPARINPLDPGPRPDRISVDECCGVRRSARFQRDLECAALDRLQTPIESGFCQSGEQALSSRSQLATRSCLGWSRH